MTQNMYRIVHKTTAVVVWQSSTCGVELALSLSCFIVLLIPFPLWTAVAEPLQDGWPACLICG